MYKPAAEILVCLVTIVLSGIMINEASTLPPGTFDPLGSGSVPIATSYILIGLALLILVRGFVTRRHSARGNEMEAGRATLGLTFIRVAGFISLTVVYVAISNMRVLHFVPMTGGFLLGTLLLLNGISRRSVQISLVVSLLMPTAIYICFTEFFTVDLPGAF